MGGSGLRPPYRPLPEISDRLHGVGGYPYRLRIQGLTFELLEILRQYLYSYMVGQGPRRCHRGSAGVGRSRWVVTMPDLGGLRGRLGGRPNSSESPGNPVRFTGTILRSFLLLLDGLEGSGEE